MAAKKSEEQELKEKKDAMKRGAMTLGNIGFAAADKLAKISGMDDIKRDEDEEA